jgi:hypothetical protein
MVVQIQSKKRDNEVTLNQSGRHLLIRGMQGGSIDKSHAISHGTLCE